MRTGSGRCSAAATSSPSRCPTASRSPMRSAVRSRHAVGVADARSRRPASRHRLRLDGHRRGADLPDGGHCVERPASRGHGGDPQSFVPLPFVVIGNGDLTFAFGAAVTLAAVTAAAAFPVAGTGIAAIAVLFARCRWRCCRMSASCRSSSGCSPPRPSSTGCEEGRCALGPAPSSPQPRSRRCFRLASTTDASAKSTTASAGRLAGRRPALHPIRRQATRPQWKDQRKPQRRRAGARCEGGWSVGARGAGLRPADHRSGHARRLGSATGARTRSAVAAPGCLRDRGGRHGHVDDSRAGRAPIRPICGGADDRVYYLAAPAVVILAARGATWAWSQGPAVRLASAALLVWAGAIATRSWTDWIR